jgi:hypothetical protein
MCDLLGPVPFHTDVRTPTPIAEEATEKRNAELVRIRQIFIPILVMRLHHELFISRTHFPPYVICLNQGAVFYSLYSARLEIQN